MYKASVETNLTEIKKLFRVPDDVEITNVLFDQMTDTLKFIIRSNTYREGWCLVDSEQEADESTIRLPQDRDDKIKLLQKELNQYKSEKIIENVSGELKDLFQEEDIKSKLIEFNLKIPAQVSASFYNQYDDEGGYDRVVHYVNLYDVKGEDLGESYEEAAWVKKSTYGTRNYTVLELVEDGIRDILNSYAEDIYELLGDDYLFNLE